MRKTDNYFDIKKILREIRLKNLNFQKYKKIRLITLLRTMVSIKILMI